MREDAKLARYGDTVGCFNDYNVEQERVNDRRVRWQFHLFVCRCCQFNAV